MGVSRPISPPLSRRNPAALASTVPTPTWGFDDVPSQITAPALTTSTTLQDKDVAADEKERTRYVASPIQLTRIQDLAPHQNVDTLTLKELLGDPMIKECWNFNFLFDLDFVMWV
jgi:tyrosyl-DNA phosphodiesterase-1